MRSLGTLIEWTEWDLNPRLPPCEGGDLPLIYRPADPDELRPHLNPSGFV